ncbi:hypothetical protein ACTOVL_03170 [Arcanobacterium canis]
MRLLPAMLVISTGISSVLCSHPKYEIDDERNLSGGYGVYEEFKVNNPWNDFSLNRSVILPTARCNGATNCIAEGGVGGNRPDYYLARKIMMSGSSTNVDISKYTKRTTNFGHGKDRVTLVNTKTGWGLQKDLDNPRGNTKKVISPNGKIVATVEAKTGRTLLIRRG